ncbi:hypothetical protein ACFQ2Y_34555 [Streptomyces malaysiensis subsp. malaysiensis]
MTLMAATKTASAARTGRRRTRRRVPCVVGSPYSPGAAAVRGGVTGSAGPANRRRPVGRVWSRTSLICSPVRRKKCWKTVPPAVATTLTTPAPRIVP